ncbi:MAG: urea ABC transporter ATP-binding subunit UrtE [Alphaproteobacteria bacterium]|jgi:urea transport system ATP-binding protein|nr:urea ABC transporter ATP-binding subunit UrtE [Alphaproteobacteria bacterium]
MLEAKDINLYYGASHILRGASVHAERGKVTCLLGRNGVGKTSMLRGVTGHTPIRSGTVTWDDENIIRLAPHARARRGIAYVPQGRDVFGQLSVEENLMTGFACLPRRDAKIPDEVFELFPVLADMLGRRGGDLSGGQQQQLAIGRALVTRPQLLVLDEPTEGIQPSIIKDIERVIRLLASRGDMAILLVEQYYEFARDLADDVVVMDRGEIVLSGPIKDMAESEIRRHLTV